MICGLEPKRFYMIFCLLMSALGGSSIAMGIAVFTIFKEFENVVGKPYLIPPTVFIISGLFSVTTTIVSYISRQSKQLTWNKIAIGIQVTGFILGIIAVVVGFTMRDSLITSLKESLQKNTPTIQPKVWDKIQHTFDCCGYQNSTEWCSTRECCVPHSCCKDGQCLKVKKHVPCGSKLSEYFDSDYYITLALVGTSIPIYMIFILLQTFLPTTKKDIKKDNKQKS